MKMCMIVQITDTHIEDLLNHQITCVTFDPITDRQSVQFIKTDSDS